MSNIEQSLEGSADTLYRFEAGERLFIWGFRSLAHHYRFGQTLEKLREVYQLFGVGDAVCSLDAILEAFARTAHTPIEIHSPGCPCVSMCERFLLRGVAAAQSDALDIARQAFERWLPSLAANWVMAPTCGLGELFRTAGWILPMHSDKQDLLPDPTAIGTWPSSSRAVH